MVVLCAIVVCGLVGRDQGPGVAMRASIRICGVTSVVSGVILVVIVMVVVGAIGMTIGEVIGEGEGQEVDLDHDRADVTVDAREAEHVAGLVQDQHVKIDVTAPDPGPTRGTAAEDIDPDRMIDARDEPHPVVAADHVTTIRRRGNIPSPVQLHQVKLKWKLTAIAK